LTVTVRHRLDFRPHTSVHILTSYVLTSCIMSSYVLSYCRTPVLRPIVLKYYALQSYVLPLCHPTILCDVRIFKTVHCVRTL
jgi:hypothetical protein